jgi:Dolichyl-phosphate-mannose-protein mannosyltransferase
MNIKLKKFFLNPFTIFLTIWGILNLLQARLTPLNNDEAYYWMYSKYLAWGYFDHPPMIAVMIRLGYFFFHNELGVRIIVVLSQLVTLSVIWLITDREQRNKKENILLFFMIAVILPVCNIYGFISTPDAPLILFSAIFLLIYKRFLENDSWQNTLFLGISIAALMYSKYHGGLLIFLIILSNLKLLKNIKFYAAAILSILLFFPHLLWQFSNDFPSVRYHLIERVSAFNPRHVPEYLASQFFFNNPFIMVVLLWIMIKVRSRNLFDKALYYIIAGFLIFFFISSFRYRVEPQWTAVIIAPMIIIVFNNIGYRPWIRNYVKWVAIILFPIFLLARAACMVDFLPVSFFKNEFHKKKQWAKDISNLAGDRPVVFTNAYQLPSVYTFYTGKFSHTLDNLAYRKTQYDLWNFEERVHGKEVLYVPHFFPDYYKKSLDKQILSNGDSVFVRVFKDFQSLQRECVVLNSDQYTFNRTGINTIRLKIFNPYPYIIDFRHNELPVVFQIAFLKDGNMVIKKNLELPENISKLNVGDTISADCKFTIDDLPSGIYKIAICSETGILYDTFNSKFKEAKINE